MLTHCSFGMVFYMFLYVTQSGYQLLIRSFNFVSLSLIEQIDNVFIKIPASTIEEPSPPDIYLGEFKPVTINLSYSMGCSPGYTLCSVNTVLQCVPEGVCIDGKSCSLLESYKPSQEYMYPTTLTSSLGKG